jgi:hypothetical protein
VLDDEAFRAFDTMEDTGGGARPPRRTDLAMAALEYRPAKEIRDAFADAWVRHIDVEGFAVRHLDDIVASKAATNRIKDRESLRRPRAFRTSLGG